MKRILSFVVIIVFGALLVMVVAQPIDPNDPNAPPVVDPNAPPALVTIRVQVAQEHIRAMRINGVTLQQLVNKEMQRQVERAKRKLIKRRTLKELEIGYIEPKPEPRYRTYTQYHSIYGMAELEAIEK